MFNMNLWNTLEIRDVRQQGDTNQIAFSRLKKKYRKFQKTMTHSQLCYFYQRALQEVRWWAYIDEYESEIAPETFQLKI